MANVCPLTSSCRGEGLYCHAYQSFLWLPLVKSGILVAAVSSDIHIDHVSSPLLSNPMLTYMRLHSWMTATQRGFQVRSVLKPKTAGKYLSASSGTCASSLINVLRFQSISFCSKYNHLKSLSQNVTSSRRKKLGHLSACQSRQFHSKMQIASIITMALLLSISVQNTSQKMPAAHIECN